VATCYNNIAVLFKNKGEYEIALDGYLKCLDIELKTLDLDHPHLAISYSNIAFILKSKADYFEALEFYQKSLDIRLNKFGIEDSRTKESIGFMKEMYQKLGKENEIPDWMNNIYLSDLFLKTTIISLDSYHLTY
jgi:tetratricopeptide (TPR) repeat protein